MAKQHDRNLFYINCLPYRYIIYNIARRCHFLVAARQWRRDGARQGEEKKLMFSHI